MEMIQTLSFM